MKKLITILLILIYLIINDEVKALTPNIIYQSGVYGNKVRGSQTYYGQLGYIYINGKIAYCLEPYKLVGDNYILDYNVQNNFNQEDIRYFTLLSYYGYNNTNHNSVYYYMATQELIWRRITGQEVYWTTENLTKGSRIDITKYKNEILTSINNHNLNISFGNSIVRGKFRETIVLEDKNDLLHYYNINNSTPNLVWKSGNKLYIKIMSSKEQNIILTRKISNGNGNVFYSSLGNQSLGSFYLNETKKIVLNVKATDKYSMKLDIDFKNVNTDNNINGSVKFKIKNVDNGEYLNDKIFESDEKGNYKSDFYVAEGNYQIELVEVPPNYVIEEGTKFTIIEDPKIETIHIDNFIDESKGIIEIDRSFDMTNIGKNKIGVPDVKYEIYSKNTIYDTEEKIIYKPDTLITTIITDEKGQANSQLLPLGEYYIKEQLKDESIIKDNNIYFITLRYKDNFTKLIYSKINIETKPEIFNLNLKVEEHKINCINDSCNETNKNLKNIQYGIFSKEDIIVNGNKVFEEGEEIIKVKTDEFGKISKKIPLLKGKYEIRELTDMSKYEEKYENISFDFNNQKKIKLNIVKTVRTQKNTLNILPKTINKYLKYYLLCIFSGIISFVKIIYDKKKY